MAEQAVTPISRAARSARHVLAVDDDRSILSVVERMLADYRVTTARDATEALAILSAGDRIDLLITDYLMPGMTGEELTHHARALRADLKILVLTGHARAIEWATPTWWAAEVHVVKPFRMDALRDAVSALIGPP